MRNKSLLLLIGILVISLLPSCRKDVKTCKLGKYYLSDGSSTPSPNIFLYNENGKVKRIGYTDGSKDTVIYNADTITIISYNRYDSLATTFTGLLNASGSVTSGAKNSYDIYGNLTGTDYLAYEYNAEGRMTKQTTNNTSGATILSLTYDGGNTKTGGLYTGGLLNKRYYLYHNTAENKTNVNDLNGVFTPWLGNSSANLLDSMHIITPSTSDTVRIQYAHTLDDNSYLSKTIQTWLTPGVQTKFHTYQYFDCN